jgi:large-conductance mechanosensitive channel
MLFEGEITEELMMLIYGFAILIISYVIVALVLFFVHRKGKNYEEKKRMQQLNKYYDSIEPEKKSTQSDNKEMDQGKQNPT